MSTESTAPEPTERLGTTPAATWTSRTREGWRRRGETALSRDVRNGPIGNELLLRSSDLRAEGAIGQIQFCPATQTVHKMRKRPNLLGVLFVSTRWWSRDPLMKPTRCPNLTPTGPSCPLVPLPGDSEYSLSLFHSPPGSDPRGRLGEGWGSIPG